MRSVGVLVAFCDTLTLTPFLRSLNGGRRASCSTSSTEETCCCKSYICLTLLAHKAVKITARRTLFCEILKKTVTRAFYSTNMMEGL